MVLNHAPLTLVMEFITSLQAQGLVQSDIERAFQAAIKHFREQRYFGRGPNLASQEWRPVLRDGYMQYVVSDWGYV